MRRDPRAFLWDVREAGFDIQSFIGQMSQEAYIGSALVQSATERKFEVIGEALNQLAKVDGALASRVPDLAQIVAFRNLLIHGYATVNPGTVWNIVQQALPGLLAVVELLLEELDDGGRQAGL